MYKKNANGKAIVFQWTFSSKEGWKQNCLVNPLMQMSNGTICYKHGCHGTCTVGGPVADRGKNLTGAYIPVVGRVGVVGVASIEVGFTHRYY